MDQYNTQLFVSSLGKEIYIKDFTTKLQKELAKAFLEENYTLIQNYINNIIKKLTDTDPQELTIIDKLLVLMRIRSRSIGNIINFSLKKDEAKYDVTYSVNDIFLKIQNLNLKPITFFQGDIQITVNIPKVYDEALFYNILKNNQTTIEDVLPCFVEKITIKEKIYLFKDLNLTERKLILDKLLVKTIIDLVECVTNLTSKIDNIVIYKDFENTYYLSLTDSSIFEYIKFLYSENLYNIYQSIYILTKHIGLTAEYVEEMTPVERDLFIKLLEKENAEIAKQERQQTSSDGASIPSNFKIADIDSFAAKYDGQ